MGGSLAALKIGAVVLVAALVLLAGESAPLAAVFPRNAPFGQCRTVHGRLALANGTFSYRIWVIGTHRMLRVVDDQGDNFNELRKLPVPIAQRLHAYKDDPFRPQVFADYTVCDFTKREPGVMQSVTVTAAKNIRIEAQALR